MMRDDTDGIAISARDRHIERRGPSPQAQPHLAADLAAQPGPDRLDRLAGAGACPSIASSSSSSLTGRGRGRTGNGLRRSAPLLRRG
jgi:hypothetical protein